jgi:hypothetical protein
VFFCEALYYAMPQLPPQQPALGHPPMGPEDEECFAFTAKVERSFSTFEEPQVVQAGLSSAENTRCSESLPQSLQTYSKRAMNVSFGWNDWTSIKKEN